MLIKQKLRCNSPNILLLIGSLLFCFAIGEIVLRFLLFSDAFKNSMIREQYHYFSNLRVEDNGYRLHLKWKLEGREKEPMFAKFDSILGWTADVVTEDNPLGIVIGRKYRLDEFKRKRSLLFFGDSFVEGLNELQGKMPQILDKMLDSTLVLNFGVRGYGLDQMYLRLRSVINHFDKPHILVGLIYPDLDRCMYKVMHAAKPYFEVSGDSLVLKGVPIPADYGQWLQLYPVTIKSYALAGFNGLIGRALRTRWGCKHFFALHPSESSKNREGKKAICRELIEKIKEVCDYYSASLTFVLFPSDYNMIHEGWYARFLKEVFHDLNVKYIDLTPHLRDYLDSNGLEWYKDLYRLRSHPDDDENRMIAKIIAGYLSSDNRAEHTIRTASSRIQEEKSPNIPGL